MAIGKIGPQSDFIYFDKSDDYFARQECDHRDKHDNIDLPVRLNKRYHFARSASLWRLMVSLQCSARFRGYTSKSASRSLPLKRKRE